MNQLNNTYYNKKQFCSSICLSVRLESVITRHVENDGSILYTLGKLDQPTNQPTNKLVGCNQSIHPCTVVVVVVKVLLIVYMYVMEESVGDSCHSHACNLMHALMILGLSSPRIGIEARRRLVQGMSCQRVHDISTSFLFVDVTRLQRSTFCSIYYYTIYNGTQQCMCSEQQRISCVGLAEKVCSRSLYVCSLL